MTPGPLFFLLLFVFVIVFLKLIKLIARFMSPHQWDRIKYPPAAEFRVENKFSCVFITKQTKMLHCAMYNVQCTYILCMLQLVLQHPTHHTSTWQMQLEFVYTHFGVFTSSPKSSSTVGKGRKFAMLVIPFLVLSVASYSRAQVGALSCILPHVDYKVSKW